MRTHAALITAAVLGLACPRPTRPPTEPTRPAVVLPPRSDTPRYAIATADPDEIALLTQQLKLRRVVAGPGIVTFEADQAQLGRLRELGYEVTQADPEAVDYRILRVRRRGTEESLRAEGITVISREPAYWIVSGSLGQLRRLVAAGYQLEAIAPDEPRPRLIRVDVSSALDVQRVANFQVDIFSVADSAGRGRFTIHGAALDMQIDRLRAAGFTVILLP